MSESRTKFEQRLLKAKSGGAIQAARDFGIDSTLILEQLRLTPEERLIGLQKSMASHGDIHGRAYKKRIDDS